MSYGSFDDFIESALCGTWTTDVLKNGTVLSSYTLQKSFEDATTPFFLNYTGCRIGGFDLNFQTGQILTGKFSVMGLGAATTTTQFVGATFPAVSTTDVMNAVTHLTSIKKDTVESTNFFSTPSLSLNNNLRAQRAIKHLPAVGIALGSLDITGNMDLYLEDNTLVNAYISGTYFSLQLTLNDGTSSYDILLPKVKYETGTTVASGLDQDVMLSGNIRAIYDSTATCAIQITRTP